MGCKTSKPSAQSASSAADANHSPGSPADKPAPKPKPFAAELDASGKGPKQSYGGKEVGRSSPWQPSPWHPHWPRRPAPSARVLVADACDPG